MDIVFQVPIHPVELEEPVDSSQRKPSQYYIPRQDDMPSHPRDTLQEVHVALSNKSVSITDQPNLVKLYVLIKRFEHLPPDVRKDLVSVVIEQFQKMTNDLVRLQSVPKTDESDAVLKVFAIHKIAVKIYLFLSVWLVVQMDIEHAKVAATEMPTTTTGRGSKAKKNASGGVTAVFGFDVVRAKCELMKRVAGMFDVMDVPRVFGSEKIDDDLVGNVASGVLSVIESELVFADKEMLDYIASVFSHVLASMRNSDGFVASLLRVLFKSEKEQNPVYLADVMRKVSENNGEDFIRDLIRQIGRLDPADFANDAAGGVKNLATFLKQVGEGIPKQILRAMGSLLPFLNCQAYTIRNAIISTLGHIIYAYSGTEGHDFTKYREDYFSILFERFRDQNAYVRSVVCQTWGFLIEHKCVPRDKLVDVAFHCSSRLLDKSAFVRRAACACLGSLLEFQPFGPILKRSVAEERLRILEEQFKKQYGEILDLDSRQKTVVQAEEAGLGDTPIDVVETEHVPSVSDKPDSYHKMLAVIHDAQEGIRFLKKLEAALLEAVHLLGSSTSSDAAEAVRFFKVAYSFHMESAEAGIRKMFVLAFSHDEAVRRTVIECFRDLFVREDSGCAESVRRLLGMLNRADIAEVTSLEEILKRLAVNGGVEKRSVEDVNNNDASRAAKYGPVDERHKLVHVLWDAACRAETEHMAPSWTAEESQCALLLLSMLAAGRPSIVQTRMKSLTEVSFGPRAVQEPFLFKVGCSALSKFGTSALPGMPVQIEKYAANHKLFDQMLQICRVMMESGDMDYEALTKCFDAVYALCEDPSKLVFNFVSSAWNQVQSSAVVSADSDRSESPTSAAFVEIIRSANPNLAASTLHAVAHFCFREYVATEKNFDEKKHRILRDSEAEAGSGIQKELDQVGAMLAEIDAEKERALAKLVTQNQLVSDVVPHLKACIVPSVLHDLEERVRIAVTVALSKLMALNRDYCMQNLQVLVTNLENSRDQSVRANIAVALGDMCFRFPNVLEPWSPYLFHRLSDRNTFVRKTSFMVISHLLLNDMIKIKDHGAQIAKLLEDPDVRIASLARLFFKEMSTKSSNNVYNILPDIFGALSADEAFPVSAFQNVSRHLIGEYIVDKERQTEALVEKICVRFRSQSAHTWKCLSFALSLFSYSDKTFKKLTENFKNYQDALVDDESFESFLAIISKMRKFSKAESKVLYDDFEQKIARSREEALNNMDGEQKAKLATREPRRLSRGSVARSAVADSPIEADSKAAEQLHEQEETVEIPKKRAARSARGKATAPKRTSGRGRSQKKVESDDEEGDDDEHDAHQEGDGGDDDDEEEEEEEEEQLQEEGEEAAVVPKARSSRSRKQVIAAAVPAKSQSSRTSKRAATRSKNLLDDDEDEE
eukprot:ANDGO_07091.mRNA.1 Condensin complex subunit 1